ncbi:hypothetical protein HDV05_002641 [Chytridiales sp. JEL 0842]|nr:hypothetical protein HDV05_002641 [Chytridiales sp. JEL 0842]
MTLDRLETESGQHGADPNHQQETQEQPAPLRHQASGLSVVSNDDTIAAKVTPQTSPATTPLPTLSATEETTLETNDKKKRENNEESVFLTAKKGEEEKINSGPTRFTAKTSTATTTQRPWYHKLTLGFFEPSPPPPVLGGPLPEPYASFFSRLTYTWIEEFMATGYKRPLTEDDLYVLEGDLSADSQDKRLTNAWEDEVERCKKLKEEEANHSKTSSGARRKKPVKKENLKPSLYTAVWKSYGFEIMILSVYRIITDTTTVASPLVILALIQFLAQTGTAVSNGTEPPPSYRGYLLAVGLFVMQIVAAWTNHKYFENGFRAGFRLKSALTSVLYKKCLRLSPRGRQQFPSGYMVNTMSTDTGRMDKAVPFLLLVFSVPYTVVLSMILLLYTLGAPALAGLFLMVIFGPLQAYIMKRLSFIRQKASRVTDQRMKVTQEALTGVRVMKFYGWEASFLKTVADLRTKEIGFVRILLIIRACISAFTTILPAFASILTFIVLYVTGGTLDAPRIFSSLALFNVLRIPCLLIPIISTELTDAKVSMDRMNDIMQADELDSPPVKVGVGEGIGKEGVAVRVAGGEFVWDVDAEEGGEELIPSREELKGGEKEASRAGVVEKEGEDQHVTPTLTDISFDIPRGALVGIVGAVGAGKSSLLQALVGEMKRTKGTVEFSGSVGYCPQTAWIQNATLKDNIIFGKPFDPARYQSVIHSCALTRDLEILPAGDATEIGERGINLSGGQRQRVSLARAVYFDADVILLDDPLSAVDAHVGKFLFEKCIMGALKDKTRILVTHQLHVLPNMDYIYYIEDGRITERGTYAELLATGDKFSKLMTEFGNAEKHADDTDEKTDAEPAEKKAGLVIEDETPNDSPQKIDDEKDKENSKLIKAEEKEIGNIGGRVYYQYILAAGGFVVAIITILIVILAQVARIGTDLWLSWWISKNFSLPEYRYLQVYIIWGVLQIIITLLSGVIFAVACAAAAKKLHDRALKKVFRAPMSYFDTTPLGRILNRFSKDVDNLDSMLPEASRMFFYTFGLVFGTAILIGAVFPYFFLCMLPAILFYLFLQKYYRNTSRELKRLENVTRSPLFAHFASCLSGLATIRAYDVEKEFCRKNRELVDWNNRAYYPLLMSQRWLGVRLELIASMLILGASLFAVAMRFQIGAGLAGLAISYSLQITGVLNWAVRVFIDTEQYMVSAERMLAFDTLDEEAAEIIPSSRPPLNWPSKGDISINSLVLRYREGLPDVLKGISVEIKSGDKVAIVGRTGAGKSSMILGLLRLVEPSGGSIIIDGIDICQIGVHDLRQRIAVIPQDPVLFSGTLRSNLDPFGEYTDVELWEVIKRSNLYDVVHANPKQLDMLVMEGGENWSTGSRQLICLARAMLRNSTIVISDEATASVDMQTDDFIQKAIRRDFKDKTVITIAHRLNTVIDNDKILVLDAGTVAEFGSPLELLNRPDGIFKSMVDQTGEQSAALLLAGRQSTAEERNMDSEEEPYISLDRVSFYPNDLPRNASSLDVALDLEWWDQSAGEHITEVGIAVQTPDSTITINRHFRVIEHAEFTNNYAPKAKVPFLFGQTEVLYLDQVVDYLRHLFSGLGNDCPVNLILFNGTGDEKALRVNDVPLFTFKRLTIIDVGRMYSEMKGIKGLKKLAFALDDMGIAFDQRGLHNAGNDAAYTMMLWNAIRNNPTRSSKESVYGGYGGYGGYEPSPPNTGGGGGAGQGSGSGSGSGGSGSESGSGSGNGTGSGTGSGSGSGTGTGGSGTGGSSPGDNGATAGDTPLLPVTASTGPPLGTILGISIPIVLIALAVAGALLMRSRRASRLQQGKPPANGSEMGNVASTSGGGGGGAAGDPGATYLPNTVREGPMVILPMASASAAAAAGGVSARGANNFSNVNNLNTTGAGGNANQFMNSRGPVQAPPKVGEGIEGISAFSLSDAELIGAGVSPTVVGAAAVVGVGSATILASKPASPQQKAPSPLPTPQSAKQFNPPVNASTAAFASAAAIGVGAAAALDSSKSSQRSQPSPLPTPPSPQQKQPSPPPSPLHTSPPLQTPAPFLASTSAFLSRDSIFTATSDIPASPSSEFADESEELPNLRPDKREAIHVAPISTSAFNDDEKNGSEFEEEEEEVYIDSPEGDSTAVAYNGPQPFPVQEDGKEGRYVSGASELIGMYNQRDSNVTDQRDSLMTGVTMNEEWEGGLEGLREEDEDMYEDEEEDGFEGAGVALGSIGAAAAIAAVSKSARSSPTSPHHPDTDHPEITTSPSPHYSPAPTPTSLRSKSPHPTASSPYGFLGIPTPTTQIDIPNLSTYVPPPPNTHVVTHPHTPIHTDELELSKGDIVGIEKLFDDGWCRGQLISRGGKRGLFPLVSIRPNKAGPSQQVMQSSTGAFFVPKRGRRKKKRDSDGASMMSVASSIEERVGYVPTPERGDSLPKKEEKGEREEEGWEGGVRRLRERFEGKQ